MRNTIAVFKNQFNEFLADKEILLFFIMFPGLAFFQTRIADLDEGVYPYQIISMLAIMFASSMMIMILPQIIAEHRENGSLRFMVMSGIKPSSYLVGMGGFFLVLNFLVALFFAWLGEFTGMVLVNFLVTILLGVICAILVAGIIGILSKNRQKAIGIAMPLGMGLVFLPMFGELIKPIQPLMNLLYVERVGQMMMEIQTGGFMMDVVVILANIAVLGIIFGVLFKLKGLKS